jgi:hypothetical protein
VGPQKNVGSTVGSIPPVEVGARDVFLNCPYDARFAKLYIAYIAAICSFGLRPRTTLEIPGGERRLDRIIQLIRTCRYSVHDLPRIEIDLQRPATHRFNMPFECGLTVMSAAMNPGLHTWFVFESRARRIQKSLSDLSGTDAYIHNGSVKGVLREIGNALVRPDGPTFQEMLRVYRVLEGGLPSILKKIGARSPFEARAFTEMLQLARESAKLESGSQWLPTHRKMDPAR